MNKKLVLSLSSMTLALAPVMMVVACGDETTTTPPAVTTFTANEATYASSTITVDKTITTLDTTNATNNDAYMKAAAAYTLGFMATSAFTANKATATKLIVNGTPIYDGTIAGAPANLGAAISDATMWDGMNAATTDAAKNAVAIYKANGIDTAEKFNLHTLMTTAAPIATSVTIPAFETAILTAPTTGRVLSDAQDIIDGVFKFEVIFTLDATKTTAVMTAAGFKPYATGSVAKQQGQYNGYATSVLEAVETKLRAETVEPAYNHISVGTYGGDGIDTVDSFIKVAFELAVESEALMTDAVAELNAATPTTTPAEGTGAKIAQDLKARALASLAKIA